MAYIKYLYAWFKDYRYVRRMKKKYPPHVLAVMEVNDWTKNLIASLEPRVLMSPKAFRASEKLKAEFIAAAKNRNARRAQSNKDQYNYRFNQPNIEAINLTKESK